MVYNALITYEHETNKFSREIKTLSTDDLPAGELLIKVMYSSLNYKDALSARGHKGITRKYPFCPGIDAAGIIEESSSDKFKAGDSVIVTGYDLGMNTFGGFGQYIRVPAEWAVPLPEGLTLREAMIIGTAGFTAGVCALKLQKNNIGTSDSKVLVTGATGGVGSVAVSLLNKIGYQVTGSTRKISETDFLKKLGASGIISSGEVSDHSGKALLSGKWDAVVDTVGGNTLATAIKSTKQHGVVCVLGNVESDSFGSTVYPFLLRGVTLEGIDSASRPYNERQNIWNNFAAKWKLDWESILSKEVSLKELSDEIDLILEGKQKGRVLVNLWK